MRVFWLVFVPAAVYQLLAIVAAFRHLAVRRSERRRKPPPIGFHPAVSVLKPLRGLDPNTYAAFCSQAEQSYPRFELLFAVADPQDPVVAEVQRLQQTYSEADIRLVIAESASEGNGKVGLLMALAQHARYPIWVVNDSDIRVTPDYLARVVAPLQANSVGVVTCLYRAEPHNLPAGWEAFGIATDFMPSTLVAQLLGVREFGLGSTLAFRAADLQQVGGFAVLAPYLADDYQLAKHITSLGKRALLSTYTVETALSDASWAGIWWHQLRWGRTIRASKGGGYAGLPITHAGLWVLIAVATGAWLPALFLLFSRSLSALLTSRFVLRSPLSKFFLLAPVWDLYAFCIWAASYAGRTVRWRDRRLTIDPQGRILHQK